MICPFGDSDWPFCIRPHGKAWDIEISGFFLNPPGIRQHKPWILFQSDKFFITKWFHNPELIVFNKPFLKSIYHFLCSWMNRENDRYLRRKGIQKLHDVPEIIIIIDI